MPALHDFDALYAFLIVFVRCSAAFMSSPLFGAMNTPMPVRIFTALALCAALSTSVQAQVGPAPTTLGVLGMSVLNEAAAGLLIGGLMQLVVVVATMAGAFLDIQIGLSASQTMNPATGIPVTVIGQFKTMTAIMVFLAINGHHLVIQSIVSSYQHSPALTVADLGILQNGIVQLLGQGCMIAIQIAAPVLGTALVVDAALGAMTKALPQLQPIQIGMPAKLALGIATVSFCLPALVGAVTNFSGRTVELIGRVFSG
jgi:flagellar biosynthetic protein FliR